MRRYNICVESYLGNNSDYKEYDNYYYETESWEKAKKICRNMHSELE